MDSAKLPFKQEDAVEAAGRYVQNDSLPSLLITGSAGSGRRALAELTAKALLCENSSAGRSCGECHSCRLFAARSHPDFKVLEAEEGTIKLADLRAGLLDDELRPPEFGRHRVYVIYINQINEQGQNALLKSIEEPDELTVYILLAEQIEQILPTVRSRVAHIALKPLGAADMRELFVQNGLPPEQAALMAKLTDGAPGPALELLRSEWFFPLRMQLWHIIKSMPHVSVQHLLSKSFSELEQYKEHYDVILSLLAVFVRDIAAQSLDAGFTDLLNADLGREFTEAGLRLKAKAAEELAEILAKSRYGRTINENFEIGLCSILLEMEERLIYV